MGRVADSARPGAAGTPRQQVTRSEPGATIDPAVRGSAPPRTRRRWVGQLAGSLAIVAVGGAWWLGDVTPATHRAIRWLSVYSPDRFAHGALWTLPLSALLVGKIPLAGITVTFFVAVVVPYLLFAGPRRMVIVFAVAHVGATGSAFVIIWLGGFANSAWGHLWWFTQDYGASAGLTGVAGALFVLLCLQRRSLTLQLLSVFTASGVVAFFLPGVVAMHNTQHGIVDVEHLLGLVIGGTMEYWYVTRHADPYRGTLLSPPPFGGGLESARRWSDRTQTRVLGGLVVLSGLVSVVSALNPRMPRFVRQIQMDLVLFVPHVHRAANLVAALGGLALILVGRGLLRRRPLSWWLTMALLVGTASAHLARGMHTAEFTFTVSVAVLLGQGRRLYRGPIRVPWARSSNVAIVGLTSAAVYGLAGLWLRRAELRPHFEVWPAVREVAGSLVGLHGPLHIAGRFGHWFPHSITVIGAATGIAVAATLLAPARHRRSHQAERAQVEGLVARADGGTLDPFALRYDKSYVFEPTGQAAVAYRVLRGVALASGDQFGVPARRDDAVAAFVRRCDAEGWRPAAIGVADANLAPWRAAGLRTLALGDEAVIDVDTFSLEGRSMRGVRQAYNRTRKHNLDVRVTREGNLSDATRRTLEDIETAHLGGQRERGFSMALDGPLQNTDRDAACVLVIASSDEVPVAFQRYVPCRAGRCLSLDVMRRRASRNGTSFVNGINERLIVEAVLWARDQGVEELSLNFAVFRSVLAAADPTTLQRGQIWLLKQLDTFFQIESLLTFNAKFAPRWIPRSLVFRSVGDLPPVAAAAMAAEGFLPKVLVGSEVDPWDELLDGQTSGGEGLDPQVPPTAVDGEATEQVSQAYDCQR
jgi:lysyl-tRNA synthetase class 2